jgi:large subunit ribosomal protein L10
MKMRKEDKAALVDEIADRLGDAEAIFAVDYRGITVPQAAELRAKLTEADATFRVVKNRLAKRATERAGTAELDRLFEGPTALAFVKGDAVTAAKAISTFGRQHDILEYKGGLMDGAPLDPDQFRAIARLPGLDVLRGQLLGVVASPLTGLARGLASMLSGLAVALGQIQERGLVGDDSSAGASDEVAVQESEPAVTPAPEPAGNGAEGEASGGDEVAVQEAEPAGGAAPEPAASAGEAEEGGGVMPEASGGVVPQEAGEVEASEETETDDEESPGESEADGEDSEGVSEEND